MTSLPPPNVTWPMVAYALVRELPGLTMITAGAVVGITLLARNAQYFEALASMFLPIVVAALSRSQPADTWKATTSGQAPELANLSPPRGP